MINEPDKTQDGRNYFSEQWVALLQGIAVAIVSFVGLGTVSALWQNPFFIRMTDVGGWEVGLLLVLSVLSGLYITIRTPVCASKTAVTGGVFGFVGIACPVCNKILLLLFGGELLVAYFEPVRIYVAIAGVVVMALAVGWTWAHRSPVVSELLKG